MPYLFDTFYLLLLLCLSPWLLYKSLRTGKYRRGLLRKFLGTAFLRDGDAPCVWFHGVSVGEIHLLRQVIARFRQTYPDWDCVVSTTTDTGYQEACKRFPDLAICYWPWDFSWAVHRALRAVNPTLVVLAEGEIWPNFLIAAKRRAVPVAVINGRLSPRSFRNYSRVRLLARYLLRHLDLIAVQTEEYALSFRALGVPPECLHVTGSVKYDGVSADRTNRQTAELGRLFDVQEHDLVWLAGSTQAPEEQIILDIFVRIRRQYPRLRLFLVPRQRERFEEVAGLLQRSGQAFVRRSGLAKPVEDRKAIVLMDTIGELGALWGLAELAYVGGSLDGHRGGQNMIEPAAYGAAVFFGPHVWNFRDTAHRLVSARAALQVADAKELENVVQNLLADPLERQRMGGAAQQLVRSQQGATQRTVECLGRLLTSYRRCDSAA
ncbi:MAG TPA: 3-deoxy-D-manno-octulosonic acid transferase [Gemmataceae bacterium]|nr:3-deoxy-D-manno-octulosonic acid transferase [Gemmataceae bacterium]